MTHVTVFWELTYCALVWPRLTRPWVLLMAVFVHGGIVLFLGMPTFGLVMLIGNLAFVSPKTVRKVFDPIARRISLAVVGKASRAGRRATDSGVTSSRRRECRTLVLARLTLLYYSASAHCSGANAMPAH